MRRNKFILILLFHNKKRLLFHTDCSTMTIMSISFFVTTLCLLTTPRDASSSFVEIRRIGHCHQPVGRRHQLSNNVVDVAKQQLSAASTSSRHHHTCNHHHRLSTRSPLPPLLAACDNQDQNGIATSNDDAAVSSAARRSMILLLQQGSGILSSSISINAANAAMLGSLPEYQDTNAILQGITIDVADESQYEETIQFFLNSFDGMKVLRERQQQQQGGVRDTWLGFGPETLSIPPSFTLPISSFAQYGGHASIHLRYDPKSTTLLYKRSPGEYNDEPAPGDSVAYLQLGVPQYRISQMVKYGGNVLDAFGWVNVVCPAGLPIRAIVGIRPDPIMFLAINCIDITQSEEYYTQLGFFRQEYPYARLNSGQGQFEPPQPKKSVYLAPSSNCMGVLLLQNKNRKKEVVPNPVLRSINIVYNDPTTTIPTPNDDSSPSSGGGAPPTVVNVEPQIMDPSSIPVSFIPQEYFEKEIKLTTVNRE